jgi:RNA polymerase sigma-70 factor (ECF subfamily)
MADEPEADQELLTQLAKGNERAFGILYDRYQGPLYRFAWHMSGDSGTAEEITQELFMLLIRNPNKYDPSKGSVAAYLFGIARNLTRRALERSRFNLPFVEQYDDDDETRLDVAATSDDILSELCRRELLEYLEKAVLSLPEQYREVVVLCDVEQMNYAAAAEFLQCSPGTVASRLHRARAILKTKMRLHAGKGA